MQTKKSVTDIVYDSLTNKRYLSIDDIAKKTQLTNAQVSSRVHYLLRQSLAERIGQHPNFKYKKANEVDKELPNDKEEILRIILDLMKELNGAVSALYQCNSDFEPCGELNGEEIYKKAKDV